MKWLFLILAVQLMSCANRGVSPPPDVAFSVIPWEPNQRPEEDQYRNAQRKSVNPAPAVDSAPAIAVTVPNRSAGVTGMIVGVHDGDSCTFYPGYGEQTKIRLNGIDAPELGQPFGAASKQALSTFIYGKTVTLTAHGTDKYGRTLGDITANGWNINESMVRRGFAWHYREYSTDPVLAGAEQLAVAGREGLWADAGAVAPWAWRKKEASSTVAPPLPASLPENSYSYVAAAAPAPVIPWTNTPPTAVPRATYRPTAPAAYYPSSVSRSTTFVKGHTRKNGTYVAGYTRTKSDRSKSNNFSSRGNRNPYSGKKGYR